jgi:ABC-type transport system involved in multi-copper enzyme maturation permease subunit
MSPEHFIGICVAETRKLFSRLTARLGLVVVAFTAVFTVLFLSWLDGSQIGFSSVDGQGMVNESTLGGMLDLTGASTLIHTLWSRNVMFMGRVFIIALAALSVASEFSSRTLREDVLRPVPRWSIPAALVVTFLFSAALALPIQGFGGPWGTTLLAYMATLAGDMGFIGITMLVAFTTRSVVGSIIVPFIFWLLSSVTGLVVLAANGILIRVIEFFPEQAAELQIWADRVATLNLWLPSSGLELWWTAALGNSWAWQSVLVLILIIGTSTAATVAVFQHQDVP